jgi:hypothetical protein
MTVAKRLVSPRPWVLRAEHHNVLVENSQSWIAGCNQKLAWLRAVAIYYVCSQPKRGSKRINFLATLPCPVRAMTNRRAADHTEKM